MVQVALWPIYRWAVSFKVASLVVFSPWLLSLTVRACVNIISLDLCIEVPGGSDWVQMTYIYIACTVPDCLWPSWMNMLLSTSQVWSVSERGASYWGSGQSNSGSGGGSHSLGKQVAGKHLRRDWLVKSDNEACRHYWAINQNCRGGEIVMSPKLNLLKLGISFLLDPEDLLARRALINFFLSWPAHFSILPAPSTFL